MRAKLPLYFAPLHSSGSGPILRYGVAVLSITLALIPALLLADVVESRLVVFAVAIMVSAWYGGWKPGLVATSFALTVSAYFSLAGAHSPAEYRQAIIHLTLFVFVALVDLLVQRRPALCAGRLAPLRNQLPLAGDQCSLRRFAAAIPTAFCSREPGAGRHAGLRFRLRTGRPQSGQSLFRLATVVRVADYLRLLEQFQGMIADWLRQDRSSSPCASPGAPFRDERNTIFFELFAEDVTEHRALEQQLRQAQKMEAVGRLAGGIAHDFNNLLMVISGYSEFLLERIGDEPGHARPRLRRSPTPPNVPPHSPANCWPSAASRCWHPRFVDLNSVVTENVKMLTRLIGEDIDLVMVPGPDIGAVKADPGQIEQVIMNLAVNARDAMPHGGKLTIETANVTLDANYARFHAPVKPGEYVMLAISDTGVGMDADTQAHIFEPFYTTKGLKGTGLGLSTVYGIVKQSEGYIWAYSEAGKGTSFKIYLPRFSASRRSSSHAACAGRNARRSSPGHETILLVEDEENFRRLARQYSGTQGYSVIDAPDGATAIQISQAHARPHSPAVDGRHHAGNERARTGQSDFLPLAPR